MTDRLVDDTVAPARREQFDGLLVKLLTERAKVGCA